MLYFFPMTHCCWRVVETKNFAAEYHLSLTAFCGSRKKILAKPKSRLGITSLICSCYWKKYFYCWLCPPPKVGTYLSFVVSGCISAAVIGHCKTIYLPKKALPAKYRAPLHVDEWWDRARPFTVLLRYVGFYKNGETSWICNQNMFEVIFGLEPCHPLSYNQQHWGHKLPKYWMTCLCDKS